jgi:hypothetical protein
MAPRTDTGQVARKKTASRPYCVPIGDQHLQQLGRQHHVAVLPALALLDPDDHPLLVDGARHQVNRLADAQAGGVAGGQDGALLDVHHTAEKMHHLLGTENDRQGPGLLWAGHVLVEIPGLSEGNAVEKSNRRDSNLDRAGIQLLLVGQIKLVVPNVFDPQVRWGSIEMSGEHRNLLNVRASGQWSEVPDLHILGHALAKVRCHWGLPCQMERAARSHSMLIPPAPMICTPHLNSAVVDGEGENCRARHAGPARAEPLDLDYRI